MLRNDAQQEIERRKNLMRDHAIHKIIWPSKFATQVQHKVPLSVRLYGFGFSHAVLHGIVAAKNLPLHNTKTSQGDRATASPELSAGL